MYQSKSNLFSSHSVLIQILLTLVIVGILTSACEEFPEYPMSEIDKGSDTNLIASLNSGEQTASFNITNLHRYQLVNDKWIELDLSDMMGDWSTLPKNICVTDGEWWLPYVLLHETGPVPISISWWCYQIAKECQDKTLFLSAPVNFSNHSDSITIADYQFKILKQTTVGFRIACKRDGRNEVETADYVLIHEDQDVTDRMMGYPSEYDMFVDLLARFRDTFGDEMDANTYLIPYATLNEPIINFDELEEILLAPYRD